MKIDLITLFPEPCQAYVNSSMLGRAQEQNKVKIKVHDLREFTEDKHHQADDQPYGGGAGMVLKPEPIAKALDKCFTKRCRLLVPSPQGKQLDQKMATALCKAKALVILCGHYEAIDERISQLYPVEEISIGEYVLTGGELPGLVIIDAVVRQIPGVIGKAESVTNDSFEAGLLDHPHFTRPSEFRGHSVPDALRSGNHAEIKSWRQRQAISKTWYKYPHILSQAKLDLVGQDILGELITGQTTGNN